MSAQPLDLLDSLMAETKAAVPPIHWPQTQTGAIAKVSYTHDAMIDMIIAAPSISQNELAARFGYTAAWISQIISSDAFQSRLADRRDEIVDPAIRASVEEQFKGLVFRSLDILRAKLSKPAEAIPDNLALRSLELSSRALGYGVKTEAPPVPPGDVTVHLNIMGERLVDLLRQKKAEALPPIEGFTDSD
jgi:transcriptional regulator with XRE-family HTH domain